MQSFVNSKCHTHIMFKACTIKFSTLQHYASSIKEAKKISSLDPRVDSILIGGKHYILIDTSDLRAASSLVNEQNFEGSVATIGIFTRSIFFPKHGHGGTLYRIGEHCLVNYAREDTVIEISKIFAVEFSMCTAMYVKGTIFSPVTEEDQISLHSYSLNQIVQRTSNQLVVLAANVARKVMLYPLDGNFILMDYARTQNPVCTSEILVPLYPQVGDMVSVSGEGNQIWLAHIHSVDRAACTCQAYFYVANDEPNRELYRRESHRLEKIHFESLLNVQSGQWRDGGLFHLQSVLH